MIYLGTYNKLKIDRDTSVGLFLTDQQGTEILLPNKYRPSSSEIGDEIEVFCYLDHQERPVATNLKPYITRDHFALLKVVEVNEYGAFLDWGLEKHILVPFREQRQKMVEGQYYVVYCYLDEVTFRLVASNKLDKFLSNESLTVVVGDEVEVVVTRKSDLGWDVIINQKHKGLIYTNEVFKDIAIGDCFKAYVKKIREDNKIDVSIHPSGVEAIEPNAQLILDYLYDHNGFMSLTDKSDPELIKEELQMSKKLFKKSLGNLYKKELVLLKPDGVYLKDE